MRREEILKNLFGKKCNLKLLYHDRYCMEFKA